MSSVDVNELERQVNIVLELLEERAKYNKTQSEETGNTDWMRGFYQGKEDAFFIAHKWLKEAVDAAYRPKIA